MNQTRYVLLRNSEGEPVTVPLRDVLYGAAITGAQYTGSLLHTAGIRPLVLVFVLEPDGPGLFMAECGGEGAVFTDEEWERVRAAAQALPPAAAQDAPRGACLSFELINGKRWACSKPAGHEGACCLELDESAGRS